MVTRVSPNCTKTDAKSRSSGLSNLQAIALATAVIDAVSSQELIKSPRYILCFICVLSCELIVSRRAKYD